MPKVQDDVLKKISERRERLAAEAAVQEAMREAGIKQVKSPGPDPALWQAYTDIAPEVSPEIHKSAANQLIDDAVQSLTVYDAYTRYIPKDKLSLPTKTESNMMRCPIPGHLDKIPSAWYNTDNQTWYCAACARGGDSLDLAAIGHGYNLDTYKSDGSFPELKRKIAADLGIVIEYNNSETQAWVPSTEYKQYIEPVAEAVTVNNTVLDTTEPVSFPEPELRSSELDVTRLDWRSLVTPGTFLEEFMRVCIVDDVPEEYHFWHGMLALSLVCGGNVVAQDQPDVHANLFVCLLGTTGSGKSKAKRNLLEVLSKAAPYQINQHGTNGVLLAPSPNSAESWVNSFQQNLYQNPSSPKLVTGHGSVRGLVEFTELHGLMAKTDRAGSNLRDVLIDFFDCVPEITSGAVGVEGGKRIAKSPHCSVLSTTQPEVLNQLLTESDNDSGFLNRWLFVGGPQKKKINFPNKIGNLSQASELLKSIFIWGGSSSHKAVFTKEAKLLFNKYWDDFMEADTKKFDTAFSRADLFMKKLALIFAINEKTLVIDERILQKAFDIYPYLKSFVEVRIRYMSSNKYSDLEQHILDLLVEHGPQTARDLERRMPRKYKGTAQINRQLTELVKADALTKESVMAASGKGRPKTLYMLESHRDGTFVKENTETHK